MKKLFALASLLFFSVSGPAGAATCNYPAEISSMPNGASASKEEMLAAQKEVKLYVKSMEEYIACLDAESRQLGEENSAELIAIQTKRHNAAVEAMEQVAERFNEQIRAYKAQQ